MELFLFLLISAVIFYVALARAVATPETKREGEIAYSIFAWPDLDEYDFEIVGESNYQDALNTIATREEDELVAYLIPEDENPYDNKAIRVDIGKFTVGYMSREDARSFRRRMKLFKVDGQITRCKAVLVGGGERNGEKWLYGVYLNLKPFRR